mgnify:CR=1 FL=1
MEQLARELACSAEQAAAGVIKLANEHMARALRVISIQRGIDPRPYALMTFGGAGALHVCALADALGMTTAIVPVHSGVLSAFGMLAAPRSRELSRSFVTPLKGVLISKLDEAFANMVSQGQQQLQAEGVPVEKIEVHYGVDLRYLGQSYTLSIAWGTIEELIEAFHQLHKTRYGHRLDLDIELVNLRVSLSAAMPKPQLTKKGTRNCEEPLLQESNGGLNTYQRQHLLAGDLIKGEALIVEKVATTYLAAGWHCKVDDIGNLILSKAP